MPVGGKSIAMQTKRRVIGSTESGLALVERLILGFEESLWAITPLWSSAVPELVSTVTPGPKAMKAAGAILQR